MGKEGTRIESTNFWEEPGTAEKPIDVVAFLTLFLRRWPFLLLCSLVCAGVGLGITFALTPRYMSKAVFLPPTPQISSSDSAISLLFKTPSTAIYSGLLMSDSVLTEVIQHNHLQAVFQSKDMEAARGTLRSLTATSTDTAGFVSIEVTYKDPKLARDIAQSFLTALSDLDDRLAISEAAQQRIIFQSQLEKAKDDLEASEVALKKAQEASGVVSAESQIKSGLSAIDLARADIRAKQVTLAALLKSETDQAPDVQRLRSEISAEEGQLGSLQGSSSSGRGSGLSAAEAPSVGLRFVQLEREVKYNEVLFDVMAKQFENAKLRESSAAPSVQIVDYPEVPLHKVWPSRRLFTVGGALVGFLVACIVVFARNRTHALRSDLSRESPLAKLIDAMSGAAIRP